MKELTLFFNFKPISLNHAFITLRNGRRAKSSGYVKYQRLLEKELLNTNTLDSFSSIFDPKKHQLKLDMIIYLKDMYTKQNILSKKAGDIMNLEKVTTDIIFKRLKLDDAFITQANISKNVGQRDCFMYRLEIVAR